jgi:hypothetical protein
MRELMILRRPYQILRAAAAVTAVGCTQTAQAATRLPPPKEARLLTASYGRSRHSARRTIREGGTHVSDPAYSLARRLACDTYGRAHIPVRRYLGRLSTQHHQHYNLFTPRFTRTRYARGSRATMPVWTRLLFLAGSPLRSRRCGPTFNPISAQPSLPCACSVRLSSRPQDWGPKDWNKTASFLSIRRKTDSFKYSGS